ncbi:integrase arm-type DNA-binding domain-containing protein [Candidatus Thiothrix sp. Deng01]|uniref:Integrase arm-type DNA-binding domain-containing protein n=1 Tax=Candidatus Thiothrix phosphatis TaxID=3112415 RepID=A0ABU6CVS5_9GAMM|nr:integrase arm-type DNA-binding domain-containing protein [Candidatus Thiothrix sp. Deng01]MEB4590239.1 integrase arm-type DNA-binding domain-containing protein [Candidatus Thiothrix sp. Deng01]
MPSKTITLLTDLEARNAEVKTASYRIKDMPGLYLEINPNGSRIWRLRYRNPQTKKETMFTVGVFPETKCAAARLAAEEAKAMVRQGIDPNTKKQRDRLRGSGKTFQEVALEWHENQLGRWKKSNAEQVLHSLELDVFPHIGKQPIDDLEAPDILAVLRRIEGRGTLPQAQKVRQRVNAVFRFAVIVGYIKGNPLPENMRGAIKAYKEKHFNALTVEDLPDFLRDLAAYRSEVLRRAVQFTLLTFARTDSVRMAEWQEIDWESALWKIPAEHMKMEQPHIIPLSSQALKLLEELRPFTGDSNLIFYTIRRGQLISENALLQVIRRIGWSDDTTIHGFRAIASSTLKDHGFRYEVVEKQLAHQGRDKVANAYDYMARYLDERKHMMQWWADFLEGQQHGHGKVIIGNFAQGRG